MTRPDLDVVLDQFAATNERDFPRAMSHYAEDVVLVVDPAAFLEGGTFEGRDAVGRWFADWFGTFEPGYRFEIEEVRELNGLVYLDAIHRGRGRTSGAEVSAPHRLPLHGRRGQGRARRALRKPRGRARGRPRPGVARRMP